MAEHQLLPIEEYDLVIVSYSGGKDSLACALYLLELGVPKHKIELWHQHIDGEPGMDGRGLMDWPVTEAYCRATAKALGLRILFQWKWGGFEREMLRDNAATAPTSFEMGDGTIGTAGGNSGKLGTRLKFPQVSADLSVRWCSAYLKIDVAAKALNNDPRFKGKKVLFITGERRQESAARAKYDEVEPHRCSTKTRRVDQWRAVIDWTEEDVWAIIRRWKVNPHPAYRLGWGRVSCLACIFGDPDQWASVRTIDSPRFNRIADYEQKFGKTIKRSLTVIQQANKGCSFVEKAPKWLVDLALGHEYSVDDVFTDDWQLPAGAFKHMAGPC